jgi:peptidoglycan/xylan/chitin deacetylase (PgdA/CDA1 family)
MATVGIFLIGVSGCYLLLNPHQNPIHRTFIAKTLGITQINPEQAAIPPSQSVGVAPTPVPILMFHYVRSVSQIDDPPGYDLSIEPTLFAAYLDRLQQADYKTITPSQFLTGMVPTKSIILSFDDGYEDFYRTAYPLLSQHKMTAVSFVITGFLDDKDGRYMTRAQVKALSDADIEIGSHTVDHLNLATADDQRAQDELLISRQVLEQITGKRVTAIAYPSGKYSDTTLRLTDYVGYSFGVTTESGITLPTSNRLKLPRIRVRGGESVDDLLAAIKKAEKQPIPLPDEQPDSIR